jgi:hypothetical protein
MVTALCLSQKWKLSENSSVVAAAGVVAAVVAPAAVVAVAVVAPTVTDLALFLVLKTISSCAGDLKGRPHSR